MITSYKGWEDGRLLYVPMTEWARKNTHQHLGGTIHATTDSGYSDLRLCFFIVGTREWLELPVPAGSTPEEIKAILHMGLHLAGLQ